MRTTAVIVHWGAVEPTVRLAQRLDRLARLSDLVVVANDDGARPDGLPQRAGWLVPGRNLGFAGGFRFGADARRDADAFLLLNNDVWLPEPTFDACLDLLAQPGVGIVGPTLVDADGIHPGPRRLTALYTLPRRQRWGGPPAPADVEFVTGSVLFLRAECHRLVPMDTRYFLGHEDADLARRARAAGWRVMVSPYQAWHAGGESTPGNTSAYYRVRNRIWFARVHGRRWQAAAVALCLAGYTLPRAAASDLLRGRGVARCRFAWHGLFDGVGPLPPRDRPHPDEPRTARWERAARAARHRHRDLTHPPGPATRAGPGTLSPHPTGGAHVTSPAVATAESGGPAKATAPAPPAPRTGESGPSPAVGEPAAAAGRATGRRAARRRIGAALAHRGAQAGLLASDLRRINAVAGPAAAAVFAAAVTRHAPTVARTGRLDAADRAMAVGRWWTFRPLPGVRVRLPGTAFGGAREMYCRGVYTARPGYAPAPGESVVDLGANQGLFSLLAAAAGASRVLAVEAQRAFAGQLAAHATANGCAGRIELVHALVGAGSGVLSDPAARVAATHWAGDVPELTIAELLDGHGLGHVDLMKIDIEGSEFALFAEPGWLDRVGRIVMEVHPQHGDPAALRRVLDEHGFTSVLLDNGLCPTPSLAGASSGYLYARRAAPGGPAGGAP